MGTVYSEDHTRAGIGNDLASRDGPTNRNGQTWQLTVLPANGDSGSGPGAEAGHPAGRRSGSEPFHRAGELVRVASVQRDPRAFGEQGLGYGEAQAGGAAADQRDAITNPAHMRLVLHIFASQLNLSTNSTDH